MLVLAKQDLKKSMTASLNAFYRVLPTQSSLAERSKALPGERLCTKIHKETVAESQLSSTRKKSRKICLQ